MGFSCNLILEFFIMLFFVLYPMLRSSPLSITTDKEALISFKSQILSDSPNPLSTWDLNTSPCNWSGVSCNKKPDPRVVGLDLSGLKMTGSVSPHLCNISFLRSLELQNNQLTGKIPDEIGNLFRLQTLNMSFNSLQGSIPYNLSQCRELQVLDIMQNQISGPIPEEITNLGKLKFLNLASNKISGALPSYLANLSSLVYLNLGTNQLNSTIPSDLSRLLNLKFLDLTINNLNGIVPPSIYNSSSLVYLAMASNNLWGEIPGDIALTLPNLLGFNFCINKFSGTIPWSLHNLTNIQIIRMAHNLLHGTIPSGIENLPYLKMYNIGFNSIRHENGFNFLELLTNSTQLEFLALDSNLFEGVIPNSIGNLSKVLTKLYMGGNNIDGTIPSSIGQLRSLELLSLINNSITGEIPEQVGDLKELRVLDLSGNRLSGKIPNSLGNLQHLTRIDLSKNGFVGSIPNSFGNFQTVTSLDLSFNKLNGSIPKEVFNLPSLSAFLNLSHNSLTGFIPTQISLLQNTMAISISDNQLFGHIPNSIKDCKSLEQLSLARNAFSGEIPPTLGELKGLEILDLSSNQLSGVIPFELQSMQSLKFLNLSFNNLEGQVPKSGIFADPSKVHLESNKKLCTDSSCRVRGRRLTFVYVIISVATLVCICSIIGFFCYLKKRKGFNKDSFESFKGQHEMISYDKLRLATDDFNPQNLIGHGSFGYVYRGLVQGVFVAIKVLVTARARSRESFLAECAALKHVRHRNLVKLITICSSIDSKNQEFLALIFDFMSNGTLDDWITGNRRHPNGMGLSILDRVRCAIGIACAIDYLHNQTEIQIVHCDLKPCNVLLDSDMTPKVADFGLAKLLLDINQVQTDISLTNALKGSIGYIPPEYGYGGKLAPAGDVYSFGILLLELFTGKSPTDEIFTGGLNLKSWVQKKFPNKLEEVLDNELLQQMNNFEISPQTCLITIFGVGLSCTIDDPDGRIGIKDALCKLRSAENTFLKTECVEQDGMY